MTVQSKLAAGRLPTFREMSLTFGGTLWNSTHGRILLCLWGSFPFVVVYLYLKRRQEAARYRRLPKQDAVSSKKPQAKKYDDFYGQLRRIFRVMVPTMFSKSGLYISIYTFVLCSRVFLTLKLASLAATLSVMMGKRDFTTMFLLQGWYGLWCYPATLANTLMRFFEKKIAIQFRRDLTRKLVEQYLSNRNYYHVTTVDELKNIDHMLTNDVEQFCSTLTFIYGHLLKPILDVLFISHSLSKMLGFKMLLSFLTFFFCSNQVLSAIRPNFSRLVVERQELEGVYRADHTRIAHFAEEIAFVNGGDREKVLIQEHFDNLTRQENRTLWKYFWKDIFDTYVLKYGGNMMAYSIIIPSVFINWKRMDSHGSQEHFLEATNLLIGLGNAIKDVMVSYKEVATLKGLTVRVHELLQNLSRIDREAKDSERKARGHVVRNPSCEAIEFQNCDIRTPDHTNSLLIEQLSLRVGSGEHLLVAGPNGTGKSSMFRVMAELWPLMSGTVSLPPLSQLYFISQNAYMVPGTLADQLTYPEHLDLRAQKSDEKVKELRELLALVDLENLLDRFKFDSVEPWQTLLSGGEKQRMVVARLYYHCPKFGVLDECTSQVSLEMEHRVFEQAKQLGITLISIAHNDALRIHHKYQLSLLGGGKWKVEEINHGDSSATEQ